MEQRSSADVEWTEVDVESAGTLVSSKGYVLVDVRTAEEHARSHAPGAVNIPFMVQTEEGRKHNPAFLEQVRQRFPKVEDSYMVVTCGGGSRGTSAATAIAEAGYAVVCMPGGMQAWAARGLPLEEQ